MLRVVFFVIFVTQILGQNSVPIPIHDPIVSSFNVQVRQYTESRIISAAQFRCMGTIITRRHVLTAAICVMNVSPRDILLILGSTSFDRLQDSNARLQHVEGTNVHIDFLNGQALNGNIAILQVNILKHLLFLFVEIFTQFYLFF